MKYFFTILIVFFALRVLSLLFHVVKKKYDYKIIFSLGIVLFLLLSLIHPKFSSLLIKLGELEARLSSIEKEIETKEEQLIALLKEINNFHSNGKTILTSKRKKTLDKGNQLGGIKVSLMDGRYVLKLPMTSEKKFPFDKDYAGSWVFLDPKEHTIHQVHLPSSSEYEKINMGKPEDNKIKLNDEQIHFIMEIIEKQ